MIRSPCDVTFHRTPLFIYNSYWSIVFQLQTYPLPAGLCWWSWNCAKHISPLSSGSQRPCKKSTRLEEGKQLDHMVASCWCAVPISITSAMAFEPVFITFPPSRQRWASGGARQMDIFQAVWQALQNYIEPGRMDGGTGV